MSAATKRGDWAKGRPSSWPTNRHRRRVRAAHSSRPRPAEGQVQQADDDVGRHHPAASRQARPDPARHGDADLGLRSPRQFRGPDHAFQSIRATSSLSVRASATGVGSCPTSAWPRRTSTTSSATGPNTARSGCSTRPGKTTASRCRATAGTAMPGVPNVPGTLRPTTPEQFNRRIGAVLFGEPGDHFGQAIELLGQTHRCPACRG